MSKRLMSLAFVVLFLGPVTGAWSLTVGPGQTVTIADAQSETYLMVRTGGTLIIESGGSLTITTSNDGDCSVDGGEMIVNGGAFLVTGEGRFNLGQGDGGTITMNDGTFTVEGDWKFCDDPGGQSRLYLDGGTVHADNIELRGERDGKIVISDGILRLDDIGGESRDPHDWVEDEYLEPAEGYDDIVIEDAGGYTEVRAVKYPPTVQFEASSSGALESVWFATLTVNLSKTQAETVTVEYAVTGGTADGSGEDYTITPSPLFFYSGETNKTINISIVNDSNDEEDETIEVTLTGVSGGDVILGDILQHTYTIIDPRPRVSFSSGLSSGRESVTPAYIEVGLSWPTDETVTVDYTVTGGTAEGNGVDYTLLGDGTLTFDPCETLEYISIAVVDDPCEEIPETIELMLSNQTSNARLGDYVEHTFTITEQLPLLRGAFYFRADSDPGARIGPHPDIMVRLGDSNDKLIFRRDKGYLPVWHTEVSGEEDLPVEIVRVNCENTINPFSRVSIIETNPARAIVHWRYAPDCSNVGVTDWVDEYFTVYPDGVCMRTVKDAAGTTFAQWDTATPDIYGLQLLPTGINTLSALWLDPPALSITSGDYSDEGFNDQRRCYTLQCNITSAPTVLNATLDTSGGKSIHDPVIVLKNWGDAEARVSVDGQPVGDCYIGYADDMYGAHLVVWLGIETPNSIDISITPSGGSGQFIDRALPPDFGYDFDADVPPLPVGSPEPGPFGAYYTCLKFNNRFDELWRVGDHTDVVVQFDDNAHRFVFWRGTNYGPHWVSDTDETSHSNWYGTQFVERRGSEWGLDGCCEPMQDWECRYSHARIISSNPARTIVHWRYAPCDKHYDIPRDGAGDLWGDWAEEYFTIYPDAVSVRKVTAYSSRTGGSDMESPHIEFHEAIPVTNPETVPEDNIHWNALSATNYNGNKRDWLAQDIDGGAMTNLHEIADKPIMVVRMKGSTVPITVVEGTSVEHDPVGQHDCRPFNAYDDWPAWPEGDRSGGAGSWYWEEDPDTHCYRNFWTKYPSHCSILHLKWDDYEHQVNQKRTKLMLFGMYDADEADNVNNLLPLARSWQYAPALSITSAGFTGGSYDKAERAYKISRTSLGPAALEFTLQGSANSPIVNPCFVIENWDSDVQLAIDGEPVELGPDFRQGTEQSADEVSSLVVWLRKESTAPIDIAITKVVDFDMLGAFCQRWLDSCSVGQWCDGWDLDQSTKVNFKDFAILALQWLQTYQ